MNRRFERMQQLEAASVIDYRYVKFNLKSAEGQLRYRDYILAEIKAGQFDPKYPDSALNQHYRSQVYDIQHYYEAEAIAYAICKLTPEKGVAAPVMQSRPEKVELFISFPQKKSRAKKLLSPELVALQLPEGKKARLVRGKLLIK